MLLSDNQNSECELNPMPYPLYLNLSRSAFLITLTDPNKQLLNVKFVFIFLIEDLVRKKYIDLLLF